MKNYQNQLERRHAEATLANQKNINEDKVAIIEAELNLYYQKEFKLLMSNRNTENPELEDTFKTAVFAAGFTAGFFLLFFEYIRLKEVSKAEKTPKKHKILPELISHFATMIGNLNLFSMVGSFTANVLGLVGILYSAITTAVAFVGSLVILAFAIPVALSTMILGVGIELVNTILNSKTPQRGTVIASDLAILGFASTALMVPFNIVPAVFMGFPIVLPLLFTGIVAASYYKDKKQLEYIEKLILRNDLIIDKKSNLLVEKLTADNQINITDPAIQHLTIAIAEAKRENAILEIQNKTLSTILNTHKLSLVAVGILIASAFIFPPLTLGAAIMGVVGIGIFLGTSLYSKKLRDDETKLIKQEEEKKEMEIGAIMEREYDTARKKIPKNLTESQEEHKHGQKTFHPGRFFRNALLITQRTVTITADTNKPVAPHV